MQSLTQNSAFILPLRHEAMGPSLGMKIMHLVSLAVFLVFGFMQSAQALFLNQKINAYSIPHNGIKIDGRPDAIWKSMASSSSSYSTISFSDYSKIVLFQADPIRNVNPELYFIAPSKGFIHLFAAYDDSAFYFFFLVKENSRISSANLCSSANLWRANAAEVFLDPGLWNTDSLSTKFSLDGSGLFYGTSPNTIQVDKSIDSKFPGQFFRSRVPPQDRFQTQAILPTGMVMAASVHTPTDSLLVGIEMKIPFWTGSRDNFKPYKSMFISWGYNHYPDGVKNTCDSTPIAYRWAKHYKTYMPGDPNKPIGWRLGDSTHFDPTRSWDGWGELYLNPQFASSGGCNFNGPDSASWDITIWQRQCQSTTANSRLTNQGLQKLKMNSKVKAVIPWKGTFWNPQGRLLSPKN